MKTHENIDIPRADLAIILGSGYQFEPEDNLKEIDRIPYLRFLNPDAGAVFSESDGGIFYETPKGNILLIFNRHVHRYQGFSPYETVLPERIALKSGVKILLLSNASGGLNPDLKVGQFMVIDKQVIIEPVPPIPPDFDSNEIKMTDKPYDSGLAEILGGIISGVTGTVAKGTYAQVPGPAYETHAEVDYLRKLGADAVGMSTALEAVYGYLKGIRVAGLVLITNVHGSEGKTTHEDVLKQSNAVRDEFQQIVKLFIKSVFHK